MRVLVTGGAGFVGGAIVRRLLDGGHAVVVVDAHHPAAHHRPPEPVPGAVSIVGDLADPGVAAAAVAGVDAVCHQASMVGLGVDFADAPAYVHHNDLATASLLAALHTRGFIGRIVLASSMVVYGEGAYRCPAHGPILPGPRDPGRLAVGSYEHACPSCGRDLVWDLVREDARTHPRSVYAATKLHQEHLVEAYVREHPGASAMALRYHNVYGPCMPRDTPYAGVASIFRSALERGEAARVFEDGGQTRDFVHVRDVARANERALEVALASPFEVCNVASGEPHTVLDMAEALTAAVGGPPPRIVGCHRPGDVRHVVASPARAEALLGVRASVRFADGMAELAHARLR